MSINLRLQEYRLQRSLDNRTTSSPPPSSSWTKTGFWQKLTRDAPSPAHGDDDDDVKTETVDDSTTIVGGQDVPEPDRRLGWLILALKLSIWALLTVIFVQIEFGAVFFVCSALYFIFTNLRSNPRRPGEPSAYSVFNPNCEAIDGTLKAEQFESELRYGSGAVRQH